jgi:hypothetical protein
MIPSLTLRGVAVMGGLSALLLFWFRARGARPFLPEGAARMFFLGAGFMLVETRAVVTMAACFGSTWIVNSVVFLAILAMILAANVFVARVRPLRSWPAYAGLFASLLVSAATPIDAFLGLPRAVQIAGASLVVFGPIFFAGIVFAVAFRRLKAPHAALGANVAGAILGGLLENASMLIGFRYLALLGLALYALSTVRSALFSSRGVRRPAADHLT